MSKDKKKSGFGKFVGGVLIGASLGVLFAPNEGTKTRKELKKKIDELMNDLQEIDVDEVKDQINKKIIEIKDELTDLDKEKVMSLAKEQANHIKNKCDDLVELAVKKGTPVLKKTTEAVREKTIEVLKETISKLEKTENTKKSKK